MKKENKTVYVIGHKNPDTDSIVSAIAYAELKKQLGCESCLPARSGKLNLQSEYVLNRFDIPVPKFIPDLVPRVRNYMSWPATSVTDDTPLWDAMKVLDRKVHKILPITDENGVYVSSLHYHTFARNLLKKIDPTKKMVISTSVNLLAKTLNAQPLVVKDEETLFKGHMLVAASSENTITGFINSILPENSIMIVGDRQGVIELLIEKGIRVLIVSGGNMVKKELKEKAREKGVSILISPYSTTATSWLALHSTPVTYMGDKKVEPVGEDLPVRTLKGLFSESVSRSIPVVDDEKKLIGVISPSDLMNEPNIEIIMVDHNELSQAVDGIENFRILEIIDHHRLGTIKSQHPITFINKPVGSTATIIAELYDNHKIAMSREIASILLAGILSDTLVLRSATTTKVDVETARYLSDITDLSIDEFGNDIMKAASLVAGLPVNEIIGLDMKKYHEGDYSFSISQVEVNSLTEIMERKEEILGSLEDVREDGAMTFSALMATDITDLNSILFVSGDKLFVSNFNYEKIEGSIFMLKGILSRKKQLLPYVAEVLKRME